MIPKISLAAAFLLMVAPPMACASNSSLAIPATMTREAYRVPLGIVVAQDNDSSAGTSDSDSDNDNDSDSNDSSDDNQNGDGSQMDQNAAGDDQPVPPTVLNNNQNDPDDAPQFNQVPQPQMNPNQ